METEHLTRALVESLKYILEIRWFSLKSNPLIRSIFKINIRTFILITYILSKLKTYKSISSITFHPILYSFHLSASILYSPPHLINSHLLSSLLCYVLPFSFRPYSQTYIRPSQPPPSPPHPLSRIFFILLTYSSFSRPFSTIFSTSLHFSFPFFKSLSSFYNILLTQFPLLSSLFLPPPSHPPTLTTIISISFLVPLHP